jgi:hypothetical protein
MTLLRIFSGCFLDIGVLRHPGWTGDQKSSNYSSTTGYTFGACTYSKIIESEKEVAGAVPDLCVGSKTFNLKAQVYLRGKR